MGSEKSEGNVICCIDAFKICPIVAIYGLLWYLNSIYGIILMIVEYQNVCFFEWCSVCIVNAAIPIVWLLIISMVDSCCIRIWSLKKWHRRHYGAAFWYFAIFTNQLLIFGTLCVYGFNVWSTINTPACNASNHLLYGFIILISASTLLILWIGGYQFYAATKYLCVYKAVLDVKKRQCQSKIGKSNGKLMMRKNGRKYSVESTSVMSLSCIHTIYRYGEENNIHNDKNHDDEDENLNDGHEPIQPSSILDLKINANTTNTHNHHRREYIDEEGNIKEFEVPPPLPSLPNPITPQVSGSIISQNEPLRMNLQLITPVPSERSLRDHSDEEIETHPMHDNDNVHTNINNGLMKAINISDDEFKEMSESLSDSDDITPSRSATLSKIEIAGIIIPTRRFTKKGHRKNHKRHDHKQYKSVRKCKRKHNNHKSDGIEMEHLEINIEQKEKDKENNDTNNNNTNHDHEEKALNEQDNNDNKSVNNVEYDIDKRKDQLFSMPVFGTAIKITSNYFDRLKEDPSTTDVCIICYDSFQTNDYLARLKCHHVYHKNCIRVWMANNHSCPLCNFNNTNFNLKLNINKNT